MTNDVGSGTDAGVKRNACWIAISREPQPGDLPGVVDRKSLRQDEPVSVADQGIQVLHRAIGSR